MIIGIDAGALYTQDDRLKTGVWRVADELIRQLAAQDVKNDYRIYSFHGGGERVVRQLGERWKFVKLPRLGYANVWLTKELLIHPVDVFLGVSQYVPANTSYNIGFIYDIEFVHKPQLYPDTYKKLTHQTRMLVRRSNHIVTISHTCARDIKRTFGTDQKCITVAYPGVSTLFSTTNPSKIHNRNPYILFVGSQKRGKNVPTVITAFRRILLKHPEFMLMIIGDDLHPDPEIALAVSANHLEKKIKLLGHVQDRQLASYYQNATALVIPSRAEGFCLPLAEAMASGCPTVASDIPVLHEIAGDSVLFAHPNDPDMFVQCVEKIISTPLLRHTLIRKGKQIAKRYQWERFAKTVLGTYSHRQYNVNTSFK